MNRSTHLTYWLVVAVVRLGLGLDRVCGSVARGGR